MTTVDAREKEYLFDGGLLAVEAHDVHLVDVARVAERDELGDPAVVEATRQLDVSGTGDEHFVQNGRGDSAALGEDADRASARLGEPGSEWESQHVPFLADEERVDARGVVHTHAVRSNDTALVLIRQLHQLSLLFSGAIRLYLLLTTLLRLRFVETAGTHDDVLGSLLHALFGDGHGKLRRNDHDRRFDALGNIHGRLVDGLAEQLSA